MKEVKEELKVETIDEILRDVQDNIERNDIDEKLKGYAERLDIMLKNGFKEDHAIKILAQMMLRQE